MATTIPRRAGFTTGVEAARLKKLTGPFILRRLKTDKSIIADLPEKMEMKVFCNLTKEHASLYAAVVKEAEEALEFAEGIQRKGVVLATLSKLKQVCNHPAQFLGDNSPIPNRSGKLARLTEMAEMILATGNRALIFTQFAGMGAILKRHLEENVGREALFLHGGVPKKQRDQMVERFQQQEHGPAFENERDFYHRGHDYYAGCLAQNVLRNVVGNIQNLSHDLAGILDAIVFVVLGKRREAKKKPR